MTTLAESFLADLDDLSDDSDRDLNDRQQEDGGADEVGREAAYTSSLAAFGFCTCSAQLSLVQMVVDDVDMLSYDNLENVAHLRASERYQDIMQVRYAALCKISPMMDAQHLCMHASLRCKLQWMTVFKCFDR